MKTAHKTILITGGLSGIGKALAVEAARDKCKIILVQRRYSKNIEDSLKSIGAEEVIQIQLDLSMAEYIEDLLLELKQRKIQPDILFNNAGLLTGGLLEEQKEEEIIKMLDVNLKALILLTKAFLPQMLKMDEACIINNASVSGVMTMPCASTYAASKAGVVAFTNCMRQELKDTSVKTLLLLTPGIKTDMYNEIQEKYGKHMDLSFLDYISAEEWAHKIWQALQAGQDTLKPSGKQSWGLWLAQHSPNVFEKRISKFFNRTQS